MSVEETKKLTDIQEQVWEVADAILESGKYPTRDDICKALKKSPHTIGSYFNEWKKVNPRSAVVKQQSTQMESSTSNSPTKNERSMANYPISDEDIQYSVAKTLATEHYYKKTWKFTVPGLRENLEEALEEIDDYTRGEDEKKDPLGMVNWLINRGA